MPENQPIPFVPTLNGALLALRVDEDAATLNRLCREIGDAAGFHVADYPCDALPDDFPTHPGLRSQVMEIADRYRTIFSSTASLNVAAVALSEYANHTRRKVMTPPAEICGRHFLPSPESARLICKERFADGSGSWADIAVEQLCKAVGAPNDADRREFVKRFSAVGAAWMDSISRSRESIDRNATNVAPAARWPSLEQKRREAGTWETVAPLLYASAATDTTTDTAQEDTDALRS